MEEEIIQETPHLNNNNNNIQTSSLQKNTQVDKTVTESNQISVTKISCKEKSEFSTITGDTFSKTDYSKDLIKRLLSNFIKEKIYPKLKFLPDEIKIAQDICKSSVHPKGNIVLPNGMKRRICLCILQNDSKNFYTVEENLGSKCN